ncbi:hypothetical protein IC582_013790 [Cucumis melo]
MKSQLCPMFLLLGLKFNNNNNNKSTALLLDISCSQFLLLHPKVLFILSSDERW